MDFRSNVWTKTYVHTFVRIRMCSTITYNIVKSRLYSLMVILFPISGIVIRQKIHYRFEIWLGCQIKCSIAIIIHCLLFLFLNIADDKMAYFPMGTWFLKNITCYITVACSFMKWCLPITICGIFLFSWFKK